MMGLRELKKEVHNLPDIKVKVNSFKNNWIKTTTYNQHLPSLHGLKPEVKKEFLNKAKQLNFCLNQVKSYQLVQEKIRTISRYLVELKLNSLQENSQKSNMITKHLLNDEFLNFKTVLADAQSFKQNVKAASEIYEEFNQLMHKELPLEEAIAFLEMPHRIYMNSLLKLSDDHSRIVRDLGRHFVSLAKSSRIKKK